MKILFFTFIMMSLSFGPSLSAESESRGTNAPGTSGADPEHSGIAGGGAGGLPSGSVGTSSFGGDSFAPTSVGTTSVGTITYNPEYPSWRRPGIPATTQPSQVLLSRRQMLDAIDTALNASDLSIKVGDKQATVRILSIDLKKATIRGRILESNKPILFIEKAKPATDATRPSDR